MKYIVALLLAGTMLFGACSTHRVLVESNLPNQVRLSSQSVGCKLHRQAVVAYWAWGWGGTKSTANLVEGAKGPVRIEFKNTPGTVLLNVGFYFLTLGFVNFKKLEVYECAE
ncbi:hypothetical protein KKF84_11290 [Myxococcota bacterium]|nr:hypothetical protein [Myxococcota bacterium]MBU1535895.1 hypothetical protein [Myxococcota bacterium]